MRVGDLGSHWALEDTFKDGASLKRAQWSLASIWSKREPLPFPLFDHVLRTFTNLSQTKSIIQN